MFSLIQLRPTIDEQIPEESNLRDVQIALDDGETEVEDLFD